jgi:hypothetical protein
MAQIKLFESWLQSQLNEDWSASTIESNYAANNGYEDFRSKPEAKAFRKFTEMVVKSGVISLTQYPGDLLFALMKHGQLTKKGFLGFGRVNDNDLVIKTFQALAKGEATLTFEQGVAEFVPHSANEAKTSGRVVGNGTIQTDAKFAQSHSNNLNLCNFMNYYNTAAFKEGRPQFVLSQRLDENGFLDLVSAPDVMGETLYLYAPKLAGTVVAQKEVVPGEKQVVGGEEAISGIFGAAFDQGSDIINDAVQGEVAKAVSLCMAKFPAGKRPDKFTLTSGASTEYNGKQMPNSNGVGAVKPIDDATKNQDLAYRRGVSFMRALNAGLKAQGHPGFDNFEIAWSIGKSGKANNPADRFVNLEIQKNAVKPVVKETPATTTTTVTGSAIQSAVDKGQYYELKLKLSAGTPAAESN